MRNVTLAVALIASLCTAQTASANQEGEEEAVPQPDSEGEPTFSPDGDGTEGQARGVEGNGAVKTEGAAEPLPAPDAEPAAVDRSAVSFARRRGASNDSAITTPGQSVDGQRADFDVNVFGYIRFVQSMVQDDPEVEFVGRNDGFRLQNARVGFEGRLRDKVMIRISAEGADDRRTSPNQVEGELRFTLADAFADIKAGKSLELRVGRFPVIFDLERFTSAVQRGFVSRSLESRGVSPTEGFESPGLGVSRNLGIALRSPKAFDTGSFGLGYELAAQNGNGSLASSNDNDSLAYSGTVLAHISDIALVFLSGRYNERTEGELPFRRTEEDLGTAFGAWIENRHVRVAGQLIFRRTTFPTTGEPDANAWGGHAEVLGAIPVVDGLRAGYRFALLDESDRIPSNRVIEHTVGAAYDLPSYGVGLKLNLTLPIEEAGRELDNTRGELLVEVQL